MRLGRTKKSRAFAYAVLIHVAVVGVLITSTNFVSQSIPIEPSTQTIVEAKLVDPAIAEREAQRLREIEEQKQREAKQEREAQERKKREAEEKKRRAERERKEKAARRLAEKKRIAEEKARLAAQKEKEAKKQRELEQARLKAEAEKQRLAEERQRAEDEKRAEQERLAKALNDELEAEEQELMRAAADRANDAEIARYVAAIRAQVESAFRHPEFEGLKCTLRVRMIPGGEVVDARVIEPSGSASFDRQAEIAVLKASPLPVPSEPALFDRLREVRFVFDPE